MKSVHSLRLLPDIWKNKSSILEGIKNRAFKKEDIEKLAEYRYSKCNTCIWNSKHYKQYEDVPEVIREIKDRDWIESCIQPNNEKCLYCTCNVSLTDSIKLRSLSANCPLPEPAWEAIVEAELQDEIYRIAKDNQNEI